MAKGIGLNMSEAMELFLRRVIIDERIPFEIIALDAAHLGSRDISHSSQPAKSQTAEPARRDGRTIGGGNQRKISKSFSRGSTGTGIPTTKNNKKGTA
ncbi:hypothetical protein HYPDE_26338 [Hyphomicrobium denitrificans 1NES1]|uniref:Uncharacterized protein n=1 Tax=Hyphomicrobium denitrificans 1NES1 TaxID=670307 RepID=N0BA18_9HYPH|nr:hypothetical protein HYPDE_26338 [Hyphomicrobium denitrificans 1NES1]